MKLKHIHIDSHKLFHDFDIDFCDGNEPLRIVVIAGINGIGKSTVLEYIRPKNMSSTHTGTIQVVMGGEDKAFDVPPSPFQYNAYREAFDSVSYFGANDTGRDSTDLEKKIVRYVDHLVYEEGKTSFEAYKRIQELLDIVFADFHLQVRFKGLNADRQLRFVNGEGAEFGVDGLSDGEKQLLVKVFPLFMGDMKGRVVLMDEPDSSLHPSWQSYLLPILRRCAEENDCQFFLATHSPQIISSAYRKEIRILIRDANGYIRAEHCEEGPYGWTVEKVLDEIQNVPVQRVPDVEKRLEALRKAVRENRYTDEGFLHEMKALESLLGYSDPDLTLIRMEIMRKQKERRDAKHQ
ncbi:AAA family ATPase [Phocaeicola salanitronis]|uniref:AAA family ATPase n=1 Tax=Phocaeicola salanitronis TaxID=376805 RepID=UPI0023F9EA64|nr:AAA family ATPase [Phocaeicola salanitronis]